MLLFSCINSCNSYLAASSVTQRALTPPQRTPRTPHRQTAPPINRKPGLTSIPLTPTSIPREPTAATPLRPTSIARNIQVPSATISPPNNDGVIDRRPGAVSTSPVTPTRHRASTSSAMIGSSSSHGDSSFRGAEPGQRAGTSRHHAAETEDPPPRYQSEYISPDVAMLRLHPHIHAMMSSQNFDVATFAIAYQTLNFERDSWLDHLQNSGLGRTEAQLLYDLLDEQVPDE